MDTASFASLVTQVRAEHPQWLDIFEGWVASDEDVALANTSLGTQLPDDYIWFMQHYGGGAFGFVEILPIVAPEPGVDDLLDKPRALRPIKLRRYRARWDRTGGASPSRTGGARRRCTSRTTTRRTSNCSTLISWNSWLVLH